MRPEVVGFPYKGNTSFFLLCDFYTKGILLLQLSPLSK
jgi:hypothetical protein